MKIYFLPILFLGIMSNTGCKSAFQPGLYENCPRGFFDCHQVLLNSDSTFKSIKSFHIGGCCSIIEGYYKIKADTLILNSYSQPKETKVEYESYISNSFPDSVEFKVFEYDGEPIIGATIRINNDEIYVSTNEFGIARTNIDSIGSIQVTHVGIDEEIEIDNPFSSKINVTIDWFNKTYYRDEIFIYRKNRVFSYYSKNEFRYKLKKVSLKETKFNELR
jgi:hypothetical protein